MYTATMPEGTPSRAPRLLHQETLLGVLPGPEDEPISSAAVRAKLVSTGLAVHSSRVLNMLGAKAKFGLVERVKAGGFCSWRKTEAGIAALNRPRAWRGPKTTAEMQHPSLAANLQRRMKDLNLSQSDVARAVWREFALDPVTGYRHPKGKDRISAYCSGAVLPRPKTLTAIAEVLKTTPEALLGDDAVAPTPTLQKTNAREHFAFTWDGGGSVMVDLKATFPEAAGREIATLITKHLKPSERRAAANGAV
jgi:transcriptional regulator with XRE-family HTH domain